MTHAVAHRVGRERMLRALAEYDRTHERTTKMTARPPVPAARRFVRVAGHAGVWELEGPALVLTDDDCFEHPSLVVVNHVADPGRWLVVDDAEVTPFVVADTPPVEVAS